MPLGRLFQYLLFRILRRTTLFVLLAIPVLAYFDALRMWHLYVIMGLTGIQTVFSSLSEQAYLPLLIGRRQVVQGNSRLEAAWSVSGMIGPTLAGIVIEWVSAPVAILGDAFSFIFSAGLLSTIREEREQARVARFSRQRVGETTERERPVGLGLLQGGEEPRGQCAIALLFLAAKGRVGRDHLHPLGVLDLADRRRERVPLVQGRLLLVELGLEEAPQFVPRPGLDLGRRLEPEARHLFHLRDGLGDLGSVGAGQGGRLATTGERRRQGEQEEGSHRWHGQGHVQECRGRGAVRHVTR